ncbi:MAG: LptF/LptG family permease [Gammaproteobacteria bacterium]|nr:LptF/LptG family permease [Gammaproteobacteria bacterium]
MNALLSRIDRYLGAVILRYTALALVALLGLFAFANFLEQLGDLGSGDYGALDALAFVALSLPRIAYELLPLAALLGALIGLSLLAVDSELIALRASGVSVARITAAALKTAALIAVAALLLGEFIVPPSELRAQRGRADAIAAGAVQHNAGAGLWLRDAEQFVNIGEVLPDMTLRRVKLFGFDSNRRLRVLRSAARGEFVGEHWLLSEVKETRLGDGVGDGDRGDGDINDSGDGDINNAGDATMQAIATAHLDRATWRTTVTPHILSVFQLRPSQLSLAQLRKYIRHLAANRQQTAPYQLAFWNKLLLPVAVAVMVALAAPFVFVNLRTAALGRSVFAGVLLGLAFFAVSRGLGYVVLAYGLPPFAGAALPLLLFALPALALHRRAG